jgi:Tfp pilus assembly protein PilX
MKTSTKSRRNRSVPVRVRNQRGIALATTLLLVVLLTAMSLTMVLTVGSDMLVNGYYGNERGSFYAADSGATLARQAIVSGILSSVPSTFSNTVQPIPPGTETSVQNSVNTTYSAPTVVTAPTGSWPEKFMISAVTVSTPTCTPSPATYAGSSNYNGKAISCTNLPPNVTGYNYIYPYSITSVGQSQGTEATTLVDAGNLIFNASVSPAAGTVVSFASYGTFIDQYPPCSSPFIAGTLTGPFFTNGAWNFGDANALGSSTKYDFKANTGQANGAVSYWHGNNCTQAASASNTANGTTIAPTFEAQFNIGASSVALPQNDYNQEQAVLDGKGVATGAPNLNSSNLKNSSGTAYPSSGSPSSGVYVPYTVGTGGVKTFSGGGIYVAGNATVTLSPSGTTGQVYTIVQSGVTTTVTVSPTGLGTGTTTIQTGTGAPNVIQGVPTMIDPGTGATTENATMLYVNGNITSLTGPGEYTTAINNGQAVTVTASGNVTVTGDIRYASEPVTTSANQNVNGTVVANADTLIPSNNTGQVLGIFTATGDIQMNNGQHDGNLEIDASIAMISQGGGGGWINVGPQINTLNVVGGRIANVAKSGNAITRNIFFDQRFAGGNFAPPWYPSTTVTASSTNQSAFSAPSVQRLQWYYKSSYQ